MAPVRFGPVAFARVRRWLAAHHLDVLHLHEPTTASLSFLALCAADGPVVATFHTATERSRALRVLGGVVQPAMERVTARIAVSSTARRVQVRHLGGDAVVIPNGVDVTRYAGPPRERTGIAFVGRYDEQRKGMAVLLDALHRMTHPARLTVVGPGDRHALLRAAGAVAGRVDVLGPVDDPAKVDALRSAAVFCAPHLHGESFGIVLAEAMAAGAPVVASDLPAFRSVLGPAGDLVPPGDAAALARALDTLLADPHRRRSLTAAGRERVAAYDWPVVAEQVDAVYRAAVAADPRRVPGSGPDSTGATGGGRGRSTRRLSRPSPRTAFTPGTA